MRPRRPGAMLRAASLIETQVAARLPPCDPHRLHSLTSQLSDHRRRRVVDSVLRSNRAHARRGNTPRSEAGGTLQCAAALRCCPEHCPDLYRPRSMRTARREGRTLPVPRVRRVYMCTAAHTSPRWVAASAPANALPGRTGAPPRSPALATAWATQGRGWGCAGSAAESTGRGYYADLQSS